MVNQGIALRIVLIVQTGFQSFILPSPSAPARPGSGWLEDYWRARFDWYSALGTAQKWEIADSASFSPAKDHLARLELIDKWREAVAKKLLTPAPGLAAVTWKQAQLKARGFSYVPVKKEQVERAIADDLAFLAAHPTRRR
jgi:hypothetical protein